MKQGLVRLLYNFGERFMGWTLHMIMCVLLCYPVSIHMSQLLSTGCPISSLIMNILILANLMNMQQYELFNVLHQQHPGTASLATGPGSHKKVK